VRLEVSDLHKTIVDMLDDPSIGGGIRTVTEMLQTYWHREDKDLFQLLDYAKRMNNGAILKRLGYLAEHILRADKDFLETCRLGMTTGNAILDLSVKKKGRLLRRWRLWVNVDLSNL
jgi:predicted transcriptional regulator of viral defense system